MSAEFPVLKDENEQRPIPEVWRPIIRQIVEALKEGDFTLNRGIDGVRKLSRQDADRIARNVENYGTTLTILPQEAWDTSACQWMRGYWEVLIDLYTIEEGASDLALSVRVYEATNGYQFHVESIHVP